MYESPTDKEFSPSFWEIEDKSPKSWKGFEGVIPGIEQALGKKHTPIRPLADLENRSTIIYHWRRRRRR